MRKIFYIFILMVSSFFVFYNNVKADTFTYIVNENDFNYLNDDFYTVRELAIDYANNYGYDYIIQSVNDVFRVYYIQLSSSYVFENYIQSNFIFPSIKISAQINVYKYNSGTLVYETKYSSSSISFVDSIFSDSPNFSYKKFLDSSIKVSIGIEEHTYILTYNNFSYTLTNEDYFPSLYEFKLIMENPPVVEPEEPEELPRNESLDSFYALVLEKIELFANYFITNTTLLFIIGIIILIFIIELIFRRYL